MRDVFILDAVRSPRGRGKAGKGALSGLHPQELLAQTLNHLAKKSGLRTADVEDVVMGCVTQANEQGANIARNSVLAAGWPDTATGVTLNRFCGSGAQAFNFAAMGVMSGQQELVVAGGVESMSRVPMGSDGAMLDGNNLTLRKKIAMVPQGISADLIATREGFTRDDVDRFALQSQHKAEAMKFITFALNTQNMAKLAQGDRLIPASPDAASAVIKSTKHYGSWRNALSAVPDFRKANWVMLTAYPRWKNEIATPAFRSFLGNQISMDELGKQLVNGWLNIRG